VIGLCRLALLCVFLVASVNAQTQRIAGMRVTGRTPLASTAVAGVIHVEAPIAKLHADGSPILSEAGLLQLVDEGPGFYYGAAVEDRIDYARERGLLGANNWGDVESFALARRIVGRWMAVHPDVRLGIDEISGRWGGFPDLDKDGVSDHLTHQLGTNVNFLVPCRRRPERYIHVGVRNEELFAADLFSDLIDILAEADTFAMTTNRALLLDPEGKERLRSKLEWVEESRRPDGYSVTWRLARRATRMHTLTPVGDHADHINCLLWRPD